MLRPDPINKLKKYFSQRQEILMAFLFGSRIKKSESSHSDWDVGVYFKPDSKYLEWEEKIFYPQENQIWQDLERILKSEVDFVVLNRAPASTTFSILSSGLPLVIKDRGIYLDLLNKISYEAIDFRNFIYDFWQIKQRAHSISEVDKARILKTLDFLSTEVQDFEKFQSLTWLEYQDDRPKRREVERWIENIVNATLDIAKIILASEKKDIPETYQETLRVLGTTSFFEPSFSERISQWAKLRNILAHQYLDLKWEQIDRFIHKAGQDFVVFVEKIKSIFSLTFRKEKGKP